MSGLTVVRRVVGDSATEVGGERTESGVNAGGQWATVSWQLLASHAPMPHATQLQDGKADGHQIWMSTSAHAKTVFCSAFWIRPSPRQGMDTGPRTKRCDRTSDVRGLTRARDRKPCGGGLRLISTRPTFKACNQPLITLGLAATVPHGAGEATGERGVAGDGAVGAGIAVRLESGLGMLRTGGPGAPAARAWAPRAFWEPPRCMNTMHACPCNACGPLRCLRAGALAVADAPGCTNIMQLQRTEMQITLG